MTHVTWNGLKPAQSAAQTYDRTTSFSRLRSGKERDDIQDEHVSHHLWPSKVRMQDGMRSRNKRKPLNGSGMMFLEGGPYSHAPTAVDQGSQQILRAAPTTGPGSRQSGPHSTAIGHGGPGC